MSTSRVSYNSNEIVLEHPFHYIPCTPYSTDPPQQIMQIDRIPLGFYILHFLHRQKDYAAVPRPLEIGIEERKTENLDLRPAASSVINWNIVVEVRSIKDSEVISPRACRHFTLAMILWRHPSQHLRDRSMHEEQHRQHGMSEVLSAATLAKWCAVKYGTSK